jgi:hypothetical protein
MLTPIQIGPIGYIAQFQIPSARAFSEGSRAFFYPKRAFL